MSIDQITYIILKSLLTTCIPHFRLTFWFFISIIVRDCWSICGSLHSIYRGSQAHHMLYNMLKVCFNSLVPGRWSCNTESVIFKFISWIDMWSISCEISCKWLPQNLTDELSAWVQVRVWCCQATSHHLSQWWLRFMSQYGITRPQWVNFAANSFNVWSHISLKRVSSLYIENIWNCISYSFFPRILHKTLFALDHNPK